MRITGFQPLQQTDKVLYIVILTGHQVSASQVQPFQLREPAGEFLFDMYQRTLQLIRTGLAMAMAMESFNAFGQGIGKQIGRNSETGTRRTRIIQLHLHFRILRIHPDATGYRLSKSLHHRIKALKLRKRIEGNVAAIFQKGRKILCCIGRRISVCPTTEFLVCQPCLVLRAGSSILNVFTENRK